jgi:hypothetical protein
MIILLSWTGAALLCAAPFIIDTIAGKILAIAGLSFLLPQTIQKKVYNLTVLNLVGIFGYLWEIFT